MAKRTGNIRHQTYANLRLWHLGQYQAFEDGPASRPQAEPRQTLVAYRPLVNHEELAGQFDKIAEFLGSVLRPHVFEPVETPRCIIARGQPSAGRLQEMFGSTDLVAAIRQATEYAGYLADGSFADVNAVPIKAVSMSADNDSGLRRVSMKLADQPALAQDRLYVADRFGLPDFPVNRLGILTSPATGVSVGGSTLSRVQDRLQQVVPGLRMMADLGPVELEIGLE